MRQDEQQSLLGGIAYRASMNTRLLLLTSLVAGSLTSLRAADDYEQHIRRFASNTPPNTVQAAVRTLRQAGTNAFPALLAHLGDKAPAERNTFQRAQVRQTPDGKFEIAVPTIGDACFDLLQTQVEGAWPKGYRRYHVLSPETARDWLTRHRGLSLQQLRIDAARESLERAEADTPKAGESSFHKQTLEFLRKNLDEAKRNAA